MKLEKFLDIWLIGTVKLSVRRSTFTVYKGYIDNHIKPELGNLLLVDLSFQNIQRFANKLCQSLAPTTTRSVILLLKEAISCAVSYGYLEKMPCVDIKMPRICTSEIQVFSKSEQRLIELTALKAKDRRNLGVVICLYTGLRLGELCALKWRDIDFENNCFTISASMNRVRDYGTCNAKKTFILEEEPKTNKSRRIIPLPQFLSILLQKELGQSKSEYVVSMKNGAYIQPRTMQNICERLLKDANVKYRNFHALRHTFATRAVELGVDIKTISDTLGHSNSNITINRYVHSLMEQKRNMMRRMDALFEKNDVLQPIE